MKSQRYGVLDFETRSEVDLKKTGAAEYSRHPSTQILCVSWRVGTKEELREQLRNKRPPSSNYAYGIEEEINKPFAAKVWSPAFSLCDENFEELMGVLSDPEIKLVAHNAFFEQMITRYVLAKLPWVKRPQWKISNLPHERWICTASMARAVAIPGNLEGTCHALKLPVQKDMDGRRLILKYCKPRKPTKNNPSRWHSSARDLRRIMLYCQGDVDAETYAFLTLPELNETERKVWLLDQKINSRGFLADRDMVGKVLTMIEEETKVLNEETKKLTGLESANQRDAVLSWLEKEGTYLPDLRAKTVSDAISSGLAQGTAKRVLEIRQAISKTSTAKYAAFEQRSRSDGRVRDILVYHTASTGRWGGAGVQPQNFPRGTIADTDTAAEVLKTGDLEWVRALYSNPMDAFSSCLRSVITAPEGKELFCADYAAIEARVLFWVSNHEDGLAAFFENTPMYEKMASVIYNVPIESVTKLQRQVGKQAFLGCGYGMGWKKFLQTCKNFGIEVDEEIAQLAVKAYRNLHYPVVKCWNNLERAAIAAVQKPGTKFRINRTVWWVENGFLWCELPSKRRLAYHRPQVKYEPTPWDDRQPRLYHYGVNPLSRKWVLDGTYGGRLCENVVQAIARDLMASAMLKIEAAGYDITLSVHDELLAERVKGEGSLKEFEALMAEAPTWAGGLPIKVEGWVGERYRK